MTITLASKSNFMMLNYPFTLEKEIIRFYCIFTISSVQNAIDF